MKTLVVDSHALPLYFEKQAGWQTVAEYLHEGARGSYRLVMSVVNWGEICYITLREYGEEHLDAVIRALDNMPVEIVNAGRDVTLEAARFKARGGLSYADTYVCGVAKVIRGAEILTGDPEFHSVENAIPVRWL